MVLGSRMMNLLDLPLELRLQTYEHALVPNNIVAACNCAKDVKQTPFLGQCTTADDLRPYVREMSYPLVVNHQIYEESHRISQRGEVGAPRLALGGTKCFATFLTNLPQKHPDVIEIVLRLTVFERWLKDAGGINGVAKPLNSMLSTLGIGTGKAYTVRTSMVRLLPDRPGRNLLFLEAEIELNMRLEVKGWLAL